MRVFKPWVLAALLLSGCYQTLPPRRPDAPPPTRALSPREAVMRQHDATEIAGWLRRLQAEHLPPSVIQPGDAFNFSVFGEPDFELKGAVVSPDGELAIPLLGEVTVAGLSLSQAREKIRSGLSRFLRNPRPVLSPYAFAGRSFAIVGKVNRPGSYPLATPLRVLDAIGLAGGFSVGIIKNDSTELADLRNAFMVRDTRVLPVDFEALVRQGRLEYNIPLLPGDYLYVPSVAQQEVYVLGDVYEQNSFPYRDGMSLSQALAYAKGPHDTANLQQVLLTRGRLEAPAFYVIDYDAVLRGQQPDVLLEAGDLIYVSAGPLKSFEQVMQVVLPTLQSLQGGLLLYEVLRNRGTTTP